jgi:hypothetical protein
MPSRFAVGQCWASDEFSEPSLIGFARDGGPRRSRRRPRNHKNSLLGTQPRLKHPFEFQSIV